MVKIYWKKSFNASQKIPHFWGFGNRLFCSINDDVISNFVHICLHICLTFLEYIYGERLWVKFMHIKIADHIATKFLKSFLQFTFLIPFMRRMVSLKPSSMVSFVRIFSLCSSDKWIMIPHCFLLCFFIYFWC